MSLDFESSSSNRMTIDTYPSSIGADGVPWSIVGWHNAESAVSGMIGSITGSGETHALRARNTLRTEALTFNGTFDTARADDYTTDTWHHFGGVWGAANSRIAYLDGTDGFGENTTNLPLTVADTLTIGAEGTGNHIDGDLAEIGIWDRAVTPAEMAAMAKGYSPLFFMNGLIAYLPMIRDQRDLMGNSWTTNGTPTVTAHPPGIIYPTMAQVIANAGAAAPVPAAVKRFLTTMGVGR